MMSVRPVGDVRPHASLGKRFLASVLDSAAALVLAGGLLIPAAGVLARNTESLEAVPVWALGLVIGGNLLLLALAIFQWWYQGNRGFTIGKLLMKIRTVDAVSGSPAGMGRILVRQLILGIGSLLVALSTLFDGQGRNRGWHDLAANTVVIDCAAAANRYSAPNHRNSQGHGQAWQNPAPRQAPPAPTYQGQPQPPALQHAPQQAGPAGDHQWQQNSPISSSHAPAVPMPHTPSSPVPAPQSPMVGQTPGSGQDSAPQERPVPAPQSSPVRAQQGPPSAPVPAVGEPARTHALPAYLVNENNAAPAGRPPAPPAAPAPAGRPPPPAPLPVEDQPPPVPAPTVPSPTRQAAPAPVAQPVAASPEQDSVIQTAPGFEERRSAAALPDEIEMTRLTAESSAAPVESSVTGIPPSATLNFSDGKRVTLTETVLIGRNPHPSSNEVIGELIRVSDPGRSVSKTHVLIGVDDEGVWVADRASTNGTIVTLADGQQILCSSHQVVRLPDGAVVSFGDYSIDFEYRNN